MHTAVAVFPPKRVSEFLDGDCEIVEFYLRIGFQQRARLVICGVLAHHLSFQVGGPLPRERRWCAGMCAKGEGSQAPSACSSAL